MGLPKSDSHKEKIRKAMTGKKSTDAKRLNISKSLSNGKHPRSLLWTIQDPRGHIYITKDIQGLCKKFNISYSTFRLRHQQKNTSPIWSGSAKGWAVLKTETAPKTILEPFIVID